MRILATADAPCVDGDVLNGEVHGAIVEAHEPRDDGGIVCPLRRRPIEDSLHSHKRTVGGIQVCRLVADTVIHQADQFLHLRQPPHLPAKRQIRTMVNRLLPCKSEVLGDCSHHSPVLLSHTMVPSFDTTNRWPPVRGPHGG